MITKDQQSSIVKKWIGTPYAPCIASSVLGVDCVQLVAAVQRDLGFDIHLPLYGNSWRKNRPDFMHDQFMEYLHERMKRIKNRTHVRFGDIVTFKKTPEIKKISHIGVMLNPVQFMHIMDDSLNTVRIEYIRPWSDLIYVIARMVK